jgi:hypothetical protein
MSVISREVDDVDFFSASREDRFDKAAYHTFNSSGKD